MNLKAGGLDQSSALPATDTDRAGRQRAAIDGALLPLLGASPSRLMLVDPPFHANTGDSLILVGELHFLRRHYPRASLSFVEPRNYSELFDARIAEADVILIHGGGNFGDLYPQHHDFRKFILERFADRPIVQFPQTLQFNNREEVETTARLIAKARDFTLLVRDEPSLRFAEQHFDCPVHLAPDMAYAAGKLTRHEPDVDLVVHLRTDEEAIYEPDAIVALVAASQHSFVVKDWPSDRYRWSVRADLKFGRYMKSRPALALWPGLSLREYCARQRVATGQRILSRGRRVITDRLHGHIFCELMGIEHIILDSYGNKITRFHNSWSSQSDLVTPIDSLNALEACLQA